MIKLISIKAKNFMSFKEFSLDLQKDGLYLISGWNRRGQDSNGSGKSSILEAICFALFGKTATGLGPDAVRNWAVKEGLLVELELLSDKVKYKIVRKDKQVEFYEKEAITPATHKRDIQTVINDTFKTNYELFTSSTFFANTKAFLAAQTDKEKKELFKPIFQLNRLDKAYERVRTIMDTTQSALDQLSYQISSITSSIKENEFTISDLEEKMANWAVATRRAAESLQETLKANLLVEDPRLSSRVADLEDKIAMLLEDMLNSQPMADSWSEELHNKQLHISTLKHRLSEIAERLSNSQMLKENEICVTCGQTMLRDALLNHRLDLQLERTKLREQLQEDSNRCIELNGLLLAYDEKKERLAVLKTTLQSAKSDLAMHLQAIEASNRRRLDIQGQLTALQNSPCPYGETLDKLRSKVLSGKEEIEVLTSQAGALSARYDALAFLKWVFSKEGVSSYIMERAYGRLESLTNRYLSMISSEGFKLEIKPQRELKSKALKEEIDIVITIQGKRIPYWGLSGGQRQRINIALLISTYRLCRDLGTNNFDFLLLDEVLDLSLADKGQADTLRLMRRLLSGEIGQIFIISHKPDVSSDFDFVINVSRNQEGISEIV